MLEEHEKTSLTVYKKVTQDLKKQEELLEERIRKKRTMSNKSTKTAENQNDEEFGKFNTGEKMDMKLLLDGINQRQRKVFFWPIVSTFEINSQKLIYLLLTHSI